MGTEARACGRVQHELLRMRRRASVGLCSAELMTPRAAAPGFAVCAFSLDVLADGVTGREAEVIKSVRLISQGGALQTGAASSLIVFSTFECSFEKR